jgi:hypothetical protein
LALRNWFWLNQKCTSEGEIAILKKVLKSGKICKNLNSIFQISSVLSWNLVPKVSWRYVRTTCKCSQGYQGWLWCAKLAWNHENTWVFAPITKALKSCNFCRCYINRFFGLISDHMSFPRKIMHEVSVSHWFDNQKMRNRARGKKPSFLCEQKKVTWSNFLDYTPLSCNFTVCMMFFIWLILIYCWYFNQQTFLLTKSSFLPLLDSARLKAEDIFELCELIELCCSLIRH